MRVNFLAVIAFAGALTSAAAHADAARAAAPSAAPWDTVEFKVRSWGVLEESWRVDADGSGTWSEGVRAAGGTFTAVDLVVHRIDADRGHVAALSAILVRLPDPAPDANACHNFMTDAPYGEMRLTRGATVTEIRYNAGCNDKPYVDFLKVLTDANDLVAGWGKAGKVLRTETHGEQH